MRLDGQRKSSNVQDRRRSGAVRGGVALTGGGVVLALVLGLVQGKSPGEIVMGLLQSGGGQQQTQSTGDRPLTAEEEAQGEFIAQVLASTEDVWNAQFPEQIGRSYQEPLLVLFSDQVSSACGMQSAAVGPFYCPGDNQVYMDTSFFVELDRRFEAPGDFARAYVVAHEVGHHIQNVLGTSREVQMAKQGRAQTEQNQLSVMLELQADCYAGVWAHFAENEYNLLERGDLEEGLNAANQIGDDSIQLRAQGRTRPHTYTHGTGEQRARWFNRGFESGDVDQCDTFNARTL